MKELGCVLPFQTLQPTKQVRVNEQTIIRNSIGPHCFFNPSNSLYFFPSLSLSLIYFVSKKNLIFFSFFVHLLFLYIASYYSEICSSEVAREHGFSRKFFFMVKDQKKKEEFEQQNAKNYPKNRDKGKSLEERRKDLAQLAAALLQGFLLQPSILF